MARARGRRLIQERERKAAEQVERKRAADRRRMVALAVGAVAVLALGVAWVFLAPEPPWVSFESVGNEHLATPDQPHTPYNSSPPSSGPHVGSLVAWQEYEDNVPAELFVHNLEDGGVALTYACPDGCDEVTDVLRSVLADYETDNVLMFPYEDIIDPDGIAHAGAAVAWGRVFYFDDFSDPQTREHLRDFISAFEGINNHVGA
jgi:hypothetical protein